MHEQAYNCQSYDCIYTKISLILTAKFIALMKGTHYVVKMRTALLISLDDVLWTAFD
jgi:hypothetical protein